MDLNFVLFPAPVPSYTYLSLSSRLIFIPRAPITSFKSDFTAIKDYGKEPAFIPCLFLKSNTSSSKIILYFHGNAEDIGQTQELMENVKDSLGHHIIAVEYPGYGIYPGYPSADRLIEDGINIYDYVANELKWKEENIILFGRSIGTGPAIHLAALKNPAALVSMSAYTSVRAIVHRIAGGILQYVLRERFRNKDMIKYVQCPTFLIHGLKDQLIPYAESQELLKACQGAPCYLSLPEEMDHGEFDFFNDLSHPLKDFLESFEITAKSKEETTGRFSDELRVLPPNYPNLQPPGFFKRLMQKHL